MYRMPLGGRPRSPPIRRLTLAVGDPIVACLAGHIIMEIDLLVELRHDADPTGTQPRLPALERLLARGDLLTAPASTYVACLLSAYDLNDESPPIAALALAGEGQSPGNSYWLRADPVRLHATIHRIVGSAVPEAALAPADALAWAEHLTPHLMDEGCDLLVAHPVRWYLRCSTPQRLFTTAPPREVTLLEEKCLPSGPDSPRWQRLMTEAQMILHDAAGDSSAAPEPPLNGIWIWGGGVAPTLDRCPYALVCSDDVLARGLARLSGGEAVNVRAGVGALLSRTAALEGTRSLIALPGVGAADLPALDADWVAPLLVRLRTGTLDALRLWVVAHDRVVARRITRALLRRWWRRSRRFADYA